MKLMLRHRILLKPVSLKMVSMFTLVIFSSCKGESGKGLAIIEEQPGQQIPTQEQALRQPGQQIVVQERDLRQPGQQVPAQERDLRPPGQQIPAQERDLRQPGQQIPVQERDLRQALQRTVIRARGQIAARERDLRQARQQIATQRQDLIRAREQIEAQEQALTRARRQRLDVARPWRISEQEATTILWGYGQCNICLTRESLIEHGTCRCPVCRSVICKRCYWGYVRGGQTRCVFCQAAPLDR